ncbi:hypothetical protein GN956_G12824 [Arapaima gigas]
MSVLAVKKSEGCPASSRPLGTAAQQVNVQPYVILGKQLSRRCCRCSRQAHVERGAREIETFLQAGGRIESRRGRRRWFDVQNSKRNAATNEVRPLATSAKRHPEVNATVETTLVCWGFTFYGDGRTCACDARQPVRPAVLAKARVDPCFPPAAANHCPGTRHSLAAAPSSFDPHRPRSLSGDMSHGAPIQTQPPPPPLHPNGFQAKGELTEPCPSLASGRIPNTCVLVESGLQGARSSLPWKDWNVEHAARESWSVGLVRHVWCLVSSNPPPTPSNTQTCGWTVIRPSPH